MPGDVENTVAAVWRIEAARVIATLITFVRDVDLAEDLAQEAVVDALRQWPQQGIPQNPGAWLTAVAKRKAIDAWRRRDALAERYAAMAEHLDETVDDELEPIGDETLRLVFVACHPVLSRESQVALTLRLVGGLSTDELARLFLVPVPTMQQRIVRAKKSLSAARVEFEVPPPHEWPARIASVLSVVYLIFTEGYAATSGDSWMRRDLAAEALRLGRRLVGLLPRESEAHGLLALMELQSSRFGARIDANGNPVLLADQDRARWDHGQIARGRASLARADALASRKQYALQAAIAEQHAIAASVETTDWQHIVLLYELLGRVAPSPVVDLNRAVAVSMAGRPEAALAIVDALATDSRWRASPLLPSVRGEILLRLGRAVEGRIELLRAAELTANERQKQALLHRAAHSAP
ncbi:MAG: RNA polymerase sigma factor [Microcella sp.]|uniref:RNA polymerase sigma factor n=1 Tax=Microcella sp. TaxID=1913979 RepID=UPI0024CB3A1E|nr:RNA polymerase sigma factor [Microcella sp.]UYN84403.1 MAG: RNA polymerase sigma factor [Microcella sp.]